ncbi:hypothetical protein [Streptomyces indicus]|uniref:Uncharacterized protein n=1 Tax=Streptomyces indicus TaxID=417292 RepID=A0A1G8YPG6_9ACTN|nr:hypothetical protein [Streptomyces indicus]SDK04636.1 hypothetical protein SAMN05421806_104186 [Streptomyces indicus]
MSTSALDDASEELLALAFAALDHATGSLQETKGQQLTTFVLLDYADGRKLVRCRADTFERETEIAREQLRAAGPDCLRYALAHDGYFTVDQERHDAVIVQAWENDGTPGLQFAQRYATRRRKLRLTCETVGHPAFAGEVEALEPADA